MNIQTVISSKHRIAVYHKRPLLHLMLFGSHLLMFWVFVCHITVAYKGKSDIFTAYQQQEYTLTNICVKTSFWLCSSQNLL